MGMTHGDFDFKRLEERARSMEADGLSKITAGFLGEPELAKWFHEGIHVIKRPDDEQGILRVSCGGGIRGVDMNYCTFRGNRKKCIDLLRHVIEALESGVGE